MWQKGNALNNVWNQKWLKVVLFSRYGDKGGNIFRWMDLKYKERTSKSKEESRHHCSLSLVGRHDRYRLHVYEFNYKPTGGAFTAAPVMNEAQRLYKKDGCSRGAVTHCVFIVCALKLQSCWFVEPKMSIFGNSFWDYFYFFTFKTLFNQEKINFCG